jgi:mono/diheme cytochrome c family protein
MIMPTAMRRAVVMVMLTSATGTLAYMQGQPATSTPSPASAPQAGAAEAPASPAAIESGRRIFAAKGCGECHGLEGQGAPTTAPRVGPQPLPLGAFIRYVRAPRLQMPPFTEKVLSDKELADIRAFLASRPRPSATAVVQP